MKESFKEFCLTLPVSFNVRNRDVEDFCSFLEKIFKENKSVFFLERINLEILDYNAIYLNIVSCAVNKTQKILENLIRFVFLLRILQTGTNNKALVLKNKEKLTLELYIITIKDHSLCAHVLTYKRFIDIIKDLLEQVEDGDGQCDVCPFRYYWLTILSRLVRFNIIEQKDFEFISTYFREPKNKCYDCKKNFLATILEHNMLDKIVKAIYTNAEFIDRVHIPNEKAFEIIAEAISLAINSPNELERLLLSLLIVYLALIHQEIIILIEPIVTLTRTHQQIKSPEVIIFLKERIIKVIEMHFCRDENLLSSEHFIGKLSIPLMMQSASSKGYTIHYIYVAYRFNSLEIKKLKIENVQVFLITSTDEIEKIKTKLIQSFFETLKIK